MTHKTIGAESPSKEKAVRTMESLLLSIEKMSISDDINIDISSEIKSILAKIKGEDKKNIAISDSSISEKDSRFALSLIKKIFSRYIESGKDKGWKFPYHGKIDGINVWDLGYRYYRKSVENATDKEKAVAVKIVQTSRKWYSDKLKYLRKVYGIQIG